MKSINDIYTSIKERFFHKTEIDVERGSAIDMLLLATSEMILEANIEIENNKTPHIYTSLEGKKLDDMAMLCGIYREGNEKDSSLMRRLLNWNISNKASNITAIEDSLLNLSFATHATFIPNTLGCGTASIYIIPKEMSADSNKIAISEVKNKIKNVIDPSTYIEYIIPKIIDVKLVLVMKSTSSDTEAIKHNITDKIIKYVNGIAPGYKFELGEINKIGISESGVEYFIVSNLIIDEKEVADTSVIQDIKNKLITSKENITWMEVS